MISIVNETNLASSSSNEVCIMERKNIVIQNEIISNSGDDLSIKYYGTVHIDADKDSEELWVDITNWLFGVATITCKDSVVRSFAVINGNAFCKIKAVTSITTVTPNNIVKIAIGY
jgi:hypothetical protein